MAASFHIDIARIAKVTNILLPAGCVGFFFLGWLFNQSVLPSKVDATLEFDFIWSTFSIICYIVSVILFLLNLVNIYYLYIQKEHAVLRNFGILGQMRYVLESFGPELRQYLVANDTEERPFNRSERSEVYRKAKNISAVESFGSQQFFDATEIKIRHSLYPLSLGDLADYRCCFGVERGITASYAIDKPVMISAMSYGALGKNATRTIARGSKRAAVTLNTGEGGYPKYALLEDADIIFQIGTAKFGVRNTNGELDDDKLRAIAQQKSVKMIEIKLSQGAKPGKGGILPKEKITPEIAELRQVGMDKDIYSPAGHAECVDAASTVAFINRVQRVSQLPVGIKMCIGSITQFSEFCESMQQQQIYPDYIAIDGAEGGTGASPKPFLDAVGMPLYPAIYQVDQLLKKIGIRQRIKLVAAGKLINANRQLIALCLGADAIYIARSTLLAIGCIQALQCGNNSCPAGITTHRESLERGLDIEQKSQRLANYILAVNNDLLALQAAVGVADYRQLSTRELFVPHQHILAPYLAEV